MKVDTKLLALQEKVIKALAKHSHLCKQHKFLKKYSVKILKYNESLDKNSGYYWQKVWWPEKSGRGGVGVWGGRSTNFLSL